MDRTKRFQRFLVVGLTAVNTFVYGITFGYSLQFTFLLTLALAVLVSLIIISYIRFERYKNQKKFRIKS